MIWDADFMLGPPDANGTDSYVLGEINVSSVFPMPEGARLEIARRVADRLRSTFKVQREGGTKAFLNLRDGPYQPEPMGPRSAKRRGVAKQRRKQGR